MNEMAARSWKLKNDPPPGYEWTNEYRIPTAADEHVLSVDGIVTYGGPCKFRPHDNMHGIVTEYGNTGFERHILRKVDTAPFVPHGFVVGAVQVTATSPHYILVSSHFNGNTKLNLRDARRLATDLLALVNELEEVQT